MKIQIPTYSSFRSFLITITSASLLSVTPIVYADDERPEPRPEQRNENPDDRPNPDRRPREEEPDRPEARRPEGRRQPDDFRRGDRSQEPREDARPTPEPEMRGPMMGGPMRYQEMQRRIREMHEAGQHERAEAMERRIHEMREQFGRPERPSPEARERGQANERSEHLEQAAQHLHAAGAHDMAEQVEKRLESARRENRPNQEQLNELRREIDQLEEQVRHMRERLDQISRR